MNNGKIDIETKVGNLKGVPVSFLGWLVVAALAVFLVHQTATHASKQHDQLLELQSRSITLLEKILDRTPK